MGINKLLRRYNVEKKTKEGGGESWSQPQDLPSLSVDKGLSQWEKMGLGYEFPHWVNQVFD